MPSEGDETWVQVFPPVQVVSTRDAQRAGGASLAHSTSQGRMQVGASPALPTAQISPSWQADPVSGFTCSQPCPSALPPPCAATSAGTQMPAPSDVGIAVAPAAEIGLHTVAMVPTFAHGAPKMLQVGMHAPTTASGSSCPYTFTQAVPESQPGVTGTLDWAALQMGKQTPSFVPLGDTHSRPC